jgi:hypothetical protein
MVRNRSRLSVLLVLLAAVVVAVFALGTPTAGQNSTYRAPRLVGSKVPDLNGVWQAMTTANWDIEAHTAAPSPFPRLLGVYGATPGGAGIVEGGQIPYQPWALDQRKKNFDNRLKADPQNLHASGDPEAKCYMPGVPRATYMPYPFQIVQSSDKILIAYEFADALRIIHMDKHEEAPIDSWMGWSNGRWDGDSLVVDVTGFIGYTWFDRAGNFHSNALKVVERYTPITPYHMQYEATMEDPKVFTRPWKVSMPLYRRMESKPELTEFKCVPFSEEFLYGIYKAEG